MMLAHFFLGWTESHTRIHCQCCHQIQGCQLWSKQYGHRLPPVLWKFVRRVKEIQGEDLTNVDWFDPDALLDMGCRWVIGDFVGQHFGLAESINEGSTSSSGGSCRRELRLKAQN